MTGLIFYCAALSMVRDNPVLTREEMHTLASTCLPNWTAEDSEAVVEIAWRESRFDSTAQNPRSSAYGLFQFTKPTRERYWSNTDHVPPLEQTQTAIRYMIDRYGSPRRALDFHNRNGWY